MWKAVPVLLILLWLPWVVRCVHFWWVQDARTFAPPEISESTLDRSAARLGVQSVHLETSDGETLLGWYRPGSPAVLYFHGRPGSLQKVVPMFENTTGGMLAISYRGYPGSTGHPTEAGLHEDARTAFMWLSERVEAEKIAIHGKSLGGLVAARLASEVDAGALVLETTYTSMLQLAELRFPYIPVAAIYRSPFDNRDVLPLIEEPTLVLAAGRDALVPAGHPRALSRQIPSAHLVVSPNASHGILLAIDTVPGRHAYRRLLTSLE